ncbi:MAG TPA: FAD-binding protein [Armatimonadota bacterium]|nr:FAD-binding protein [Armatimonadota bacterium]
MYDLAIVGAGPAGAMLARLIGTRHRVLLLDRRRLDTDPRPGRAEKCCGGLLAPDAQQVLAELGLGVPREVLSGPQLFSVRTLDADHGLERAYQRFYINCHRDLFDRWLVSRVPSGVATRFGALVTGLETDAAGATLILAGGETVRARLVVGADGARARIRRLAFPRWPAPPQYLAVQEWCAAEAVLPYFTAIFDRAVTDFYGWTIPKDDHLIIGAALAPGGDALETFARFKARLAGWGISCGPVVKREGALVARPSALAQLCPGAGRVLLIGEAAGWISPSSAEGLSYAFRSAIALADSLDDLDGVAARYRRACAGLRRNILGKLLKSPFMYAPWLRALVLRAGVGSLAVRGASAETPVRSE